MAKIGILGGTFNPIHNGHISLAEAALVELALDKVILIPSGVSYMKAMIDMPDKEMRYEMTCLAAQNHEKLLVSDIEIKREGNSYTYETLLELKEANPLDEFIYIIGADTLFSIEKWVKPQMIFELATIAVAVRDDYDLDALNSKCNDLKDKFEINVILLNAPKIDISSSAIRRRLEDGNNIADLIPESVYQYIKEHKLYNIN